ncbi:unnamed protein product [Moneuplotes crassus]|uniref:Uncharacterized protein n=1 Tax=Euplotes crassus TaxID=5936 RepID=A0AAD1U853_EUPCR|nr:unnamed protein product [Moneuplotes crassus]
MSEAKYFKIDQGIYIRYYEGRRIETLEEAPNIGIDKDGNVKDYCSLEAIFDSNERCWIFRVQAESILIVETKLPLNKNCSFDTEENIITWYDEKHAHTNHAFILPCYISDKDFVQKMKIFEKAYQEVPIDLSHLQPEGMHSDFFLESPITAFAESNSEYDYQSEFPDEDKPSIIEKQLRQVAIRGNGYHAMKFKMAKHSFADKTVEFTLHTEELIPPGEFIKEAVLINHEHDMAFTVKDKPFVLYIYNFLTKKIKERDFKYEILHIYAIKRQRVIKTANTLPKRLDEVSKEDGDDTNTSRSLKKERNAKQTQDNTSQESPEATINVIINRSRKNKEMNEEEKEEDAIKEEEEKEDSRPNNIDKIEIVKWDLNTFIPKMHYALTSEFIGLDEDKNKIFKLPPCEIFCDKLSEQKEKVFFKATDSDLRLDWQSKRKSELGNTHEVLVTKNKLVDRVQEFSKPKFVYVNEDESFIICAIDNKVVKFSVDNIMKKKLNYDEYLFIKVSS